MSLMILNGPKKLLNRKMIVIKNVKKAKKTIGLSVNFKNLKLRKIKHQIIRDKRKTGSQKKIRLVILGLLKKLKLYKKNKDNQIKVLIKISKIRKSRLNLTNKIY